MNWVNPLWFKQGLNSCPFFWCRLFAFSSELVLLVCPLKGPLVHLEQNMLKFAPKIDNVGYSKLPKSLSVPPICPVFWLVLYLTGQGSTWPESFLSFVQGRTPNISSVLVKAAFFLLIWACSSHRTPPGAPCAPLRSYVVGCFPSERASSPPPLSVE